MFPSNPWKDISNEGTKELLIKLFDFHLLALNFIQSLLELERKKRLVINKVFLQSWLQVESFFCMNYMLLFV
jgi:hypothetical protein